MDHNNPNDDGKKEETIKRRSFLKSAAAATGIVAAGGLATSVQAASSDYETVVASQGELLSIDVRDGETLENVLYDITADGAGLYIDARGDDWTIRNIGVKGAQGKPAIMMKVACGSGETGLIENLYMGDGHDMSQSGDMKAGIFAFADTNGSWPHHQGHITIRNANVQQFGDGIYMSGPAVWTPDKAGTVTIEQCYGRSNNVAQFRVAKNGDVVRDSVALSYEGETPPNPAGVTNGRGIRAVDGNGTTALAKNCDVHTDSSWPAFHTNSQSELTVRDCSVDSNNKFSGNINTESWDTNVDTTPPAGVPMTAEEAASGTSSAGDGTTSSPSDGLANTISITGEGSDTVTPYEFTVSDTVEKSTANGASIDSEDSIDGQTATGAVANGTDSYEFAGEISSLTLDGDATVMVNGEVVDPSQFSNKTEHTLSVSGGSSSNIVSYEFTVGDTVEKSTANGASIDSEDSIDGQTATGAVANGTDSYVFTGKLLSFSLDGDAEITVDGEVIDPSQYNSDSGSAPSIDSYEVTEIGSRNRAANITAKWGVSDADGDLSSVTVEVINENGDKVDSDTTNVSGDTAYDVDYFAIPDADGQSFDVKITVLDESDKASSATKTVQE